LESLLSKDNQLPQPGRPRAIAIIQARRASIRLPDKVLLEICGQPMLVRVVERTRGARTLDSVIIATTTDPTDDAIQALCETRGYPFYRGSSMDVLDRYYQTACRFKADIIVRITADCPLIDPGLIDEAVRAFTGMPVGDALTTSAGSKFPYDFVANRLPPPWGRTFPVGLDLEVCSLAGLELAWKEAVQPHQREHVMPFFYEQPQRFRILLLNHEPDYGKLRWTVDTPADLELLRQIFARFPGRSDFSWLEVVELFQREPQLANINVQVQPKDYRAVDHRLVGGAEKSIR
jgi:spore coat polysaccharide biosynthesis protein SpsF